MPTRRFRPPFTFEDHNNACFLVKDANGLAAAYVYYEEEAAKNTVELGKKHFIATVPIPWQRSSADAFAGT